MKKPRYKPKRVIIYGVWSTSKRKLEKVSLSEEEMELELQISYDEETHQLVQMPIMLLIPEVMP